LLKVYRAKHDRAVLQRLKSFAEQQTQDLEARLALLPAAVRPTAQTSIATLQLIDRRVNAILTGCSCPANPLVPSSSSPQAAAAAGSPDVSSGAPACACTPQAPGEGLGPTDQTAAQQSPPPQQGSAPPAQQQGIIPTLPQTGIAPVDQAVNSVDQLLQQLVPPPPGVSTSPAPSAPTAEPSPPAPKPKPSSGISGLPL
jgi:hypothetical protein